MPIKTQFESMNETSTLSYFWNLKICHETAKYRWKCYKFFETESSLNCCHFLGYFIFSKSYHDLPKIAQLAKTHPILSPWLFYSLLWIIKTFSGSEWDVISSEISVVISWALDWHESKQVGRAYKVVKNGVWSTSIFCHFQVPASFLRPSGANFIKFYSLSLRATKPVLVTSKYLSIVKYLGVRPGACTIKTLRSVIYRPRIKQVFCLSKTKYASLLQNLSFSCKLRIRNVL